MNNLKTYTQYNEGILIPKKNDDVAKKILNYITEHIDDRYYVNFSKKEQIYIADINLSEMPDDPLGYTDWNSDDIFTLYSSISYVKIDDKQLDVSDYLIKKIYRTFENIDNVKKQKERKGNVNTNKKLNMDDIRRI